MEAGSQCITIGLGADGSCVVPNDVDMHHLALQLPSTPDPILCLRLAGGSRCLSATLDLSRRLSAAGRQHFDSLFYLLCCCVPPDWTCANSNNQNGSNNNKTLYISPL